MMTHFHCIISNFEKKHVPLLTKDFSPKVFGVVSFSQKGELYKKWNLKAI